MDLKRSWLFVFEFSVSDTRYATFPPSVELHLRLFLSPNNEKPSGFIVNLSFLLQFCRSKPLIDDPIRIFLRCCGFSSDFHPFRLEKSTGSWFVSLITSDFEGKFWGLKRLKRKEEQRKKWVIRRRFGIAEQRLRLRRIGMASIKLCLEIPKELQLGWVYFFHWNDNADYVLVSILLWLFLFDSVVLWGLIGDWIFGSGFGGFGFWWCRLAYMEDKFVHGEMSKGKNFSSQAVR